jgi:hypothetical protein
MSGKYLFGALVTMLAVASVVGCSAGTTTIINSASSAPASTPATSPSPGSGSTTPASSSAVDRAKAAAATCIDKIGSSGLAASAARSQLADCLENFESHDDDISSDDDDAFEHCLAVAASNDQVWTSEGREKFTNTSVPNCLNQARSADDHDDDGDGDD